jgi:hypothetical protein
VGAEIVQRKSAPRWARTPSGGGSPRHDRLAPRGPERGTVDRKSRLPAPFARCTRVLLKTQRDSSHTYHERTRRARLCEALSKTFALARRVMPTCANGHTIEPGYNGTGERTRSKGARNVGTRRSVARVLTHSHLADSPLTDDAANALEGRILEAHDRRSASPCQGTGNVEHVAPKSLSHSPL